MLQLLVTQLRHIDTFHVGYHLLTDYFGSLALEEHERSNPAPINCKIKKKTKKQKTKKNKKTLQSKRNIWLVFKRQIQVNALITFSLPISSSTLSS